MAQPPPSASTSARFPSRIRLVGEVEPDRVADAYGALLERQLGRAFEITAERGAPRLGKVDITWTGVAPSAEHKAATEAALVSRLVDKVQDARRTAPVPRAPAAPAKPARKQRPVPPTYAWHPFQQIGDADFQYAFALALGLRWETAAAVPDAYAVMFRIAGVAEIQMWIVVGRAYVTHWGLTHPSFRSGGTDAPDPIGAGTGEWSLDRVPDGLEQYKQLAIDDAKHQLAGLSAGQIAHVPDVEAALRAHEAEARKLVDAYLAAREPSAFYKLSAAHAPWRLLPLTQDIASKLGERSHFDVVCLVDPVTAEQADDLDADEADERGDSLLALVPDGAGGDGSGTGADRGDGTGAGGGRGVVIPPTYQRGGSIFPGGPPIPGADRFVLTCEPYDGEAPLDQLGAAGEQMQRLIAEIAQRLDMPACHFPAHFCLSAFSMIMVRRTQVAARVGLRDAGFFEPLLVSERDRNGAYTFRPVPSVAIQFLQHLAATVPLLRRLQELVHAHSAPRMAYAGWYLSFLGKLGDAAVQACGDIYYTACQICLHQLLNASLAAVEDRRQRGEAYVQMFRALLRSQLANQVESVLLANALAEFTGIVGHRRGEAAFEYYRLILRLDVAVRGDLTSRRAQLVLLHDDDRDLAVQLADATGYVFRRAKEAEAPVASAGQVVEADTGEWGIIGSDGRVHVQADLQQSIALRRQVVAGIDPLLSQIMHDFVTEIRPLVEDETKIPAFVTRLLDGMTAKNEEVTRDNLASTKYAFEHGQIHRVSTDPNDPPALHIPTVSGGRFILSGIHAIAHDLVGRSFADDEYYHYVLDHLLGHELASKELRDDLVFIGTIALSVICPPLGAAVGVVAGIVTGIQDYRHAKQQESIYGALIHPEDVLSYAEIQVEILAAKLGIGLSFLAAIPEIGSALKGLGTAAKGLAKTGVEASARAVARHVLEQQLEKLGEMCAEKFVVGLARELATASVMNKVMEAVISPFMEAEIRALEAELADETGDHPEPAGADADEDDSDEDDDLDGDAP